MSGRVRWRYVVVGLGFLALAGARAAQGAPVWAVVFAVAAGVNGWLAVHEAARPAPLDPAGIELSEVESAMRGHLLSARQWQLLGLAGLLVGGVLLLLHPPLAVFAGAAALFAVHRARRSGRAAATLRRAAVIGR